MTMFVTSIKELHEKFKTESKERAKQVNIAAVMNLDNIKNNTSDQDAHKSLLYLRGVLAGLFIGGYINSEEYDAILFEINSAYRERKKAR